jgi:hypothetical protein
MNAISSIFGAIISIIAIAAIFAPAPYIPLLAAVYFPFLIVYVIFRVNGK